MKQNEKLILDVLVTAVYDIGDQKLVAIFSSAYICGKYCFATKNRAISKYIHDKAKCSKNVFGRKICFRVATQEQKDVLGDKEFLILDPRFERPEVKSIGSGYN